MEVHKELSKLNKITLFIFSACNFNVKNLTFLFWGLLSSEQMLSIGIEYLFWGDHFRHWGDTVAFTLLPLLYYYYVYTLSKLLTRLHLDAVTP